MNTPERYALLTVVLVIIIGSIVYLEYKKTGNKTLPQELFITTSNDQQATETLPRAREIVQPSGFINSPHSSEGTTPFTLSEFVGKKVILLDIWTYSCINCQRTLPYIITWDKKYRDDGLLVIGIHTPEFDFEKEYENVQRAVQKFGITYPVVLDNDYGTWNNYNNRYWPRKYLIDIHGSIAYDHIGEGAYEETEEKIQELLHERAEYLGITTYTTETLGTVTKKNTPSPASTEPRTPEIYFGAQRNELFANGTQKEVGIFSGELPALLLPSHLYLQGQWDITHEYAETQKDASVHLHYSGADVYMVAESKEPVRMQVFVDGVPVPQELRGAHVDKNGFVEVREPALYHIIHDSHGWGERSLELRIQTPGLRAFTFTFG